MMMIIRMIKIGYIKNGPPSLSLSANSDIVFVLDK